MSKKFDDRFLAAMLSAAGKAEMAEQVRNAPDGPEGVGVLMEANRVMHHEGGFVALASWCITVFLLLSGGGLLGWALAGGPAVVAAGGAALLVFGWVRLRRTRQDVDRIGG